MKHGSHLGYRTCTLDGGRACDRCRAFYAEYRRKQRGEQAVVFTYETGQPIARVAILRPFQKERRVARASIEVTPKGQACLASMKGSRVA